MSGNGVKELPIVGDVLQMRVQAIDLDSGQPKVKLQLPHTRLSIRDPILYIPTIHLLPQDAKRVADAILLMVEKAKSHQR